MRAEDLKVGDVILSKLRYANGYAWVETKVIKKTQHYVWLNKSPLGMQRIAPNTLNRFNGTFFKF